MTVEEFKNNLKMSSEVASEYFEKLDTDKNGKIDYTEWLAAAKDWTSKAITPEVLNEAFIAFDTNLDGYIDYKDLQEGKLNA